MSDKSLTKYHLNRLWLSLYHINGTLASTPRGAHHDRLKEIFNKLRAYHHFLKNHPYPWPTHELADVPGSANPGATAVADCPDCDPHY